MDSSKVNLKRGKILPCVFDDSVECSFRMSEKITVMGRCWNCSVYKRFLKGMDEEDAETDREIEFIHKYGYEAFDREFKKKGKR
jgi:hypothetical protein